LIVTGVAKGDANFISKLLTLDADVNASDYDHRCGLHLAAALGKKEMIKLLACQYDANVNVIDSFGHAPLDDAFENGHEDVIDLLQSLGASLQLDSDLASFRLCYLAYCNDFRIRLLIKAGYPINEPDYDGRTCLHLAAAEGHLEMVKLLTELGADLAAVDSFGENAVTSASKGGHLEIVDWLLSNGSPRVQETQFCNLSRFHHRLHFCFPPEIEASRLSSRADLSYPGAEFGIEFSVLACLYARFGNLADLASLMEKNNFETNLEDYDMRTPLHIACVNGHADIVGFLLRHGANPNAIDRWGRSPIWDALSNNRIDIVKTLMLYGGRLRLDNFWTSFQFFKSVLSNDLHTVDVLLSACGIKRTNFSGVELSVSRKSNAAAVSASINSVKDYDGRTALHIASSYSNALIAHILLKYGADPHLKDRWNLTPLDIARSRADTSVLRVFQQFGFRRV